MQATETSQLSTSVGSYTAPYLQISEEIALQTFSIKNVQPASVLRRENIEGFREFFQRFEVDCV